LPNVLSVRKSNEIVAHGVSDEGVAEARNAPRLVILIHGYQNSQRKAEGSFESFRRNVERYLSGGFGAVWEFHWPGDDENWFISVAGYSNSVHRARSAGALLASHWLAFRRPWQSVVIVAHSLGCRVALEAVREVLDPVTRYTGPSIEVLCLLAAAVPTSLCATGESFGEAYDGAHEHVFCSASDRVLQWSFGPGQRAAGEPGHAVGRSGGPARRWTSSRDTGLGHSDYWTSRAVALAVARLVGRPVVRPLDGRLMAQHDLFMAERELATRSTGRREIARRP
jgi:hypothetical protein